MTDVIDRLNQVLSTRYRIERELGAGGMATVYLAADLRHDRMVAVKVLRPELSAALGAERFLREIKIAAGLHHPHILPLFDSGEADGFLFYVMPYEEGRSLRDRIDREGALPIEEAVRILRDVADALVHAHEEKVVHRDIKPDNIMLSGRHALVTDFGVARAVREATEATRLTTEGTALGTPSYMAPEQVAGEAHVDQRADIYALGAVAYELLTGRPPFLGTTVQMVLSAHVADPPEPVRKYRKAVPRGLEALILRCLEKNPADRWQSAEEVVKELEALRPTSGGRTAVEKGSGRQRGGPRRVVLAASAVLVAVVVVVLTLKGPFAPGGPPALNPDRVIVLPFENRTGDPSLDQLGAMAADWVTEGLMDLANVVEPVPTSQVAELLMGSEDRATGSQAGVLLLARATNAGTVVSGSYYLQGDSLEFQGQVLDVQANRVLGATPPVRGPVQDPRQAIGHLRQEMATLVAARLERMMQVEIPGFVQPPRYEAFQAYSAGFQATVDGDWVEALENLNRAYAIDTTYVRARVLMILPLIELGRMARAESLAVSVVESVGNVTRYDRLRAEFLLAGLRGDRMAAYQAAREGSDLAPGGTLNYAVIGTAVSVNRPREALEAARELVIPEGRGRMVPWHFGNVAAAQHMLGDHEAELETARAGREVWPAYLPTLEYEVRALAALGEVDTLEGRLDEAFTLPTQRGVTPGEVARTAARELDAHGYPHAASDVLDRARLWDQGQADSGDGSEAGQYDRAQTLYLAGNLPDAEALFERLHAALPADVDYLGYLGTTAAREGDTARAREISEELQACRQPYVRGLHTLWRARIAALLGEKERAVALLREAFAQGREYGPWLHSDPDFRSLWAYGPFQEVLRPKG